jgi:hypothetical protein
MAQFASNNPLTRKVQQEVGKKVGQFVSEQVAKNGPKALEAAQSFANGARGPIGSTPVKNTTTNKVANEAGGLARDIATDKPKKQMEANAKQVVNKTANVVTNKVNQATQSKPMVSGNTNSGKPNVATGKPGLLGAKPGMGMGARPNINAALNKPMSAPVMANKPKVATVKPNVGKKLTEQQRKLERE